MGFFNEPKKAKRDGDEAVGSNAADPIVKRIRQELKDSEESTRKEWVEEMKLCRKFMAGDQWPDEDQDIMNAAKKPQITFNRAAPLIDVVVGTEIQHRRRMIFLPQDPTWNAGSATADLATHAIDWALELAKAPHKRSRIFRDAVIGGIGWGTYFVDVLTDPDGRMAMDRVDPTEMRWDPNARATNLTDKRWCARKRRWSRNEIVDEFDVDLDEGSDEDSDLLSEQLSDDTADASPRNIVQHYPDPWREGSQEIKGDESLPSSRYDRKLHWVTEFQSFDLEKYVRVRLRDLSPQLLGDDADGDMGMGADQDAAGEGAPPTPGGPSVPPPAAPPPPGDSPPPGGGGPPPGFGMSGMTGAPPPPPPGPSAPAPSGPSGADAGMPPGGAPDAQGPDAGPPPGPPPVPPWDDLPEEDGQDHPPVDKWKAFSVEEFDELLEKAEMLDLPPPEAVTLRRRVYRQTFICNSQVLRDEDMFVDDFSYLALTCKWDDDKRIWYGLMRPLIDPQRAANKWLSQGIHHFNSGAKGVLLIEQGVVVNPKSLQTDWTKPNSVILFKADMLAQERFRTVEPAPFPEAAASIMQWSVGAMRDVAGVNVELAGASEGQESSVTVQKRQSQGMTILAPVFDSLDQYRENEAYLALKIVKEFLADGRAIRIAGPYPAKDKFVRLLKEDFAEAYDLRLDDVPRDPNQKMAVFEALQPLMPMWERMGGIPDPIKDFFPLPASVVQEWKKWEADKKAAPPGPPPKDQDPEFIKAEIAYKNAQAQLMIARAEAISRESMMGMVETAQDVDLEKQKLALDKMDLQLRRRELELNMRAKHRELGIEEDKGTLDALEANSRLASPGYPGE